jgi:DNA-binding MarR family transcriptional regulator
MRASRALVAVAARSMAGLGDITLPQYRALVVLAERGPLRAGDLADALGVHPSTLTRLADRLVVKRLIVRRTAEQSRREVEIVLADTGRELVADVARRRLEALVQVFATIDASEQDEIQRAFETFATAAGELVDHDWAIPWA